MTRTNDDFKNIKVTHEMHQRLKVFSAVCGKQLQEVVNQALDEWMKSRSGNENDQASDLRTIMREKG